MDVTFTPLSNYDNATFADALCALLDDTTASLAINRIDQNFYVIPPCLLQNATQLTQLTAYGVIISDFRLFPSILTRFEVYYSKFVPLDASSPSSPTSPIPEAPATSAPSVAPESASPTSSPSSTPTSAPSAASPDSSPISTPTSLGNGINPDGTMNWDDIWNHLADVLIVTMESCGLIGSLPTSIPYRITYLDLNVNRLTGTIPSTLFSSFTEYSVNAIQLLARTNLLEGSIPHDLFAAASVNPNINTYNLDFRGNQLSGSFPADLFHPLNNVAFFQLDFTGNDLTGPLSDDMFRAGMMSSGAGTLSLYLTNNPIGGTIPPLLMFNHTSGASVNLDLANTQLSGELPPVLFPSGYYASAGNYLNIDFSLNSLTGSIPNGWIAATLTQNTDLQYYWLYLQSNQLEGTIPEALLYRELPSKRDAREPKLDQDSWSEVVRASSGSDVRESEAQEQIYAITANSILLMNFDTNNLSGQIPSTLLAYAPSGLSTQIYFSHNSLNGTIPDSWQTFTFRNLDLSYNPNISGTIPPLLFNSTGVVTFGATSTALSGAFPSIGNTLTTLNLRSTKIDFCEAASAFGVYSHTCDFSYTDACQCPQLFTACMVFCAPSAPPPTPAPIVVPAPSSSAACPNSTRPSLDFTCVNGSWTAQTITTPRLSVAPNSGNIVITGNLTSSSIVFAGLGTTIVVNGCANNLSSVSMALEKSEAGNLGDSGTRQTLVNVVGSASGGTVCTSLNNVMVSTSVKSGGCKKVKSVKELSNDGKTLSALFTLDSAGCNTWWIILVSVVVAVIIITLVVLILLGIFYAPFRRKFRPYEQSNGRAGTL